MARRKRYRRNPRKSGSNSNALLWILGLGAAGFVAFTVLGTAAVAKVATPTPAQNLTNQASGLINQLLSKV